MRIVIALGGNALLPKGGEGTANAQLEAAKKAIAKLEHILKANEVVLTHGNGPQVGSLLIQQQGTKEVAPMPLDVLDAMTQGQIGYFIASAISMTGLHSATLITRVVVDPHDAAFKNPSKPIGPFYEQPVRPGMKMDAGRGYRLFVASPEPMKIREHDAISALLERDFVVIAVGGGGIPIKKSGEGLEAVIDKDRATSLLANQINADMLVFVTSVDEVYLDFGKKTQKPIRHMAVAEAKKHITANHFAEGSMKPKIESVVRFLENGGKKAVICSISNIEAALEGKAGTIVIT
ncbi:MAG: carbamate kinase [Candidatus ainarchaeum sp.]|nr:carbamate kinase [Candidatus ainarchaeum sp.]